MDGKLLLARQLGHFSTERFLKFGIDSIDGSLIRRLLLNASSGIWLVDLFVSIDVPDRHS
jgi:hypothetical protein